MNKTPEQLIEILTSYVERGWPVFPIKSGDKKPLTEHGFKDASTVPAQINKWMKKYPNANWAIATGSTSGVFVVDADLKTGGRTAWVALCNEHDPITTLVAQSGGGGLHYYFKYPNSGRKIKSGTGVLAPGIDIKGDGGYIIVPPSITQAPYIFDVPPTKVEVADAPEWLLEGLDGHAPKPKPKQKNKAKPVQQEAKKSRYKGLPDSIPEGSRNSAFTSYAGRLRYDNINENDIWEALLEANTQRAHPPLDEVELKRIFDSVMKYPPGKRKLTDAGNAERLIDNYGADIRYVAKMGHWIIWNGKYWQPDRTALIYSRALKTARKIYDEAMKTGEDLEGRKALLNHAMRSESRMKLAAMVEVAKSQQEIVIDPKALDADLHKLNVQNGTLNLATRRLEPQQQEDFITRALDIVYDRKAKCPEWENWLTWAFAGDKDLIHYMQQIIGRTLFGGNPEKELFFSYGATDTGKTTLMTLLEKIGGPYVKRFNIELLLHQPRSRSANDATPELAKLFGAHFAIGSEMPNGRKLDDAIVKDLSGRDTMTSRGLYQSPFEYTPQFIMWLYGNYRPAIDAEDEALWNRMKVIPFRSIIPANKKDPNLVNDKFMPELAGILNWAFEGAIEAYNTLLPVPAAVMGEKEDYRTDMDYVKQFAESGLLEVAPGGAEKLTDIYRRFESYILVSVGLKHCPVNSRSFGHRLPNILNAQTRQGHGNQTYLVGWHIVGAENG